MAEGDMAEGDMVEVTHETLLESLFDGVYYVDGKKNITFWNRAAERISGFSRSEVLGSCCADNILRHIDDEGHELCVDGCPLAATMTDGEVREANVYLHHKDGHRVPVAIRVSPVRDAEGAIVGGVEVFADSSNVIEMLEEMEKLKQDAFLDQLTRVGNRRYCEMVLHTRIYELKAFKVPFGVVFLDIDRFKQVNDTYGHQTGDKVLRMVAGTVASSLRKLDIVARWGGEELVVVLPNLNAKTLQKVAERIRAFIQKSFIMSERVKIAVTASIGATMAVAGDTPESIVDRADSLMYASKRAGRNRTTIG